MSVKKMKEFENGEEFVFDGVKKIPIIGAVYSVPRTVVYAAMGNKKQTASSASGIIDNVLGTGRHILTSPYVAATAISGLAEAGVKKLFGT